MTTTREWGAPVDSGRCPLLPLFRICIDVEPKLRFAPHMALMVMANMALAGARLPLSIVSKFRGDFNNWYPLHRQIPMIVRVMSTRGEAIRKAEKFLKKRFADAPEA